MSDTAVTVEKTKKIRKESELSYWGSVFFRFRKKKMAMFCIILLSLIVLGCLFIPIITPHNIVTTNVEGRNQPPSITHLFGTDEVGRDLFVRFFHGGRISLGIALTVVTIECMVGIIMGCIAGFYGKVVDTIIMRICEILMSFPFLMFCITVIGMFGNSIPILIFVLVLLTWPSICRIVRGQILTLRELEYMEACEALGISDLKRIYRHLLPNVLAYVIVFATLAMGSVILTEAALSFLGLGVAPPTPTWGNMIEPARQYTVLAQRWWIWMPPGLGIFISVMCFNIVGDGLRDAIDPKMKR